MDDESRMNLEHWDKIQGWFDFEDIYNRMAEEVLDREIIIELGVWKGKSLIYLADRLKQYAKWVPVIGIDAFDGRGWGGFETIGRLDRQNGDMRTVYQQCMDNIEACGVGYRTKIIQADCIEAAGMFANESVRFLFIDDTHESEHIKREIAAWLPKMQRPTFMAGHDYPGDIKAGVDAMFPNVKIVGSCWLAELP